MVRAEDLVQLPMDLRLIENQFVPIPIADTDIGGQLLPLLSKGLYTNPLHCVREYVQNAVDAAATHITIKITGNSVYVLDDGRGMNIAELVQARQFGVSAKDVEQNVGFRGIGIYSGFDLCNRLLITTKKKGEKNAYVLEFDFGSMKNELKKDLVSGKSVTSLSKLLESFSKFSQEREQADRHYTMVQLEDISDVHVTQLSNREELKNYILRNLPIDFDDAFAYKEEINTHLRANIPGFKAVKVTLESDDAPKETVTRPLIPHLGRPEMVSIGHKGGKPQAYLWACLRTPKEDPETGKLTESRGRIPDEFADYRGLVYKIKGFTIGDNHILQRYFKKGNAGLYLWYTGEIYVIDTEVIPNTERDDFETSPAQEMLKKVVIQALKSLEGKASAYQEQGRALDKFNGGSISLVDLKKKVEDGPRSLIEIYSELDQIIDDLKNQKRKLPADKKQWGQELLNDCEKLRKQISQQIDNPQPAQKQRAEAIRNREPVGEALSAPESMSVQPTPITSANPVSTAITPAKRLIAIIQDSGWGLPDNSVELISLIERSLDDILSSSPAIYSAFLADIEVKLSKEISD